MTECDKEGLIDICCELSRSDMFGYTWDWEKISEAYREKKNYICEKCKIEVEPLDRFYIHVHHKDKDKTSFSLSIPSKQYTRVPLVTATQPVSSGIFGEA